jgi:hypothetical protein
MPVIGYLSGGTAETLANFAAAFRHGLSEVGYVEGRNVVIDYRGLRIEMIACRNWQPSWFTITWR